MIKRQTSALYRDRWTGSINPCSAVNWSSWPVIWSHCSSNEPLCKRDIAHSTEQGLRLRALVLVPTLNTTKLPAVFCFTWAMTSKQIASIGPYIKYGLDQLTQDISFTRRELVKPDLSQKDWVLSGFSASSKAQQWLTKKWSWLKLLEGTYTQQHLAGEVHPAHTPQLCSARPTVLLCHGCRRAGIQIYNWHSFKTFFLGEIQQVLKIFSGPGVTKA